MRHALAALWMLFLAAGVSASTTTSAITGRVLIEDAPASDVTVTATSASLMAPRTTITNARGTYWLGELPPGLYDVTFSHAGTTTLTRRTKVELARVAHADAKLEPNADEESVTSTATQISVADTTAITSHFDDGMLDRFPLGRIDTLIIAPGDPSLAFVDGALHPVERAQEDGVEQSTAIRGAVGLEDDSSDGAVIAIRTRSGSEQLLLSLRDTITNHGWIEKHPFEPPHESGLQHLAEATAGGRIIPGRLWFFANGWSGDSALLAREDVRGFEARLDGQATPAINLTAIYTDTRSTNFFDAHSTIFSLAHTTVLGPRFTTTAVASRTTLNQGFGLTFDRVSGRASYVIPAQSGDHVITGGVTAWGGDTRMKALFAGDRWSVSKWTVNAGARYDHNDGDARISPRMALTYDLRGDGARAISASAGEYAELFSASRGQRIATLGFASVIGSSGSARIDVLHRDGQYSDSNELQMETRYRLFDRFEAGATYTYRDHPNYSGNIGPDLAHDEGNAWIGAELPLAGSEIGVTLLQRYYGYGERQLPTDLALRYTFPFLRGLALAVDTTNIAAQGEITRTFRAWIRLRA